MKAFTPQKAFLGLISTGDENAVLSWRGLASESSKLWTFKDYIDRKWMKNYKVGGAICAERWREGGGTDIIRGRSGDRGRGRERE